MKKRRKNRRKYMVRRAMVSLILIGVLSGLFGMIRTFSIQGSDPETEPTPPPPPPPPVVYSPVPEVTAVPRYHWKEIDDLVPEQYRELVIEAAGEFGVPPRLVASQVNVENAPWDPYAVGTSGEIGLMQILPTTQEEVVALGLVEMCDLTNAECNLRTGTAYLSIQVSRYNGDFRKALRYYNGGPTWEEKPVTAEYADKILRLYYNHSIEGDVR